jgi:mannosyltransferase OCH1-like enzyme
MNALGVIVMDVADRKIPRILHFIWVGDESRRPDNCIDTWRKRHGDWEIKVWGNRTLVDHEWVNARHMKEMSTKELNGVADMMRWEILYNEGGVVLDADSICLRPLEDEFLDNDSFCCWENETARPGLLAAGYFGSCAQNEFVGQIILDIQQEESVVNDKAWKTVGPLRLTQSYFKYKYTALKIYPSHYFIPEHFTGVKYTGSGPVYAAQLWGSTKNIYENLHRVDLSE